MALGLSFPSRGGLGCPCPPGPGVSPAAHSAGRALAGGVTRPPLPGPRPGGPSQQRSPETSSGRKPSPQMLPTVLGKHHSCLVQLSGSAGPWPPSEPQLSPTPHPPPLGRTLSSSCPDGAPHLQRDTRHPASSFPFPHPWIGLGLHEGKHRGERAIVRAGCPAWALASQLSGMKTNPAPRKDRCLRGRSRP